MWQLQSAIAKVHNWQKLRRCLYMSYWALFHLLLPQLVEVTTERQPQTKELFTAHDALAWLGTHTVVRHTLHEPSTHTRTHTHARTHTHTLNSVALFQLIIFDISRLCVNNLPRVAACDGGWWNTPGSSVDRSLVQCYYAAKRTLLWAVDSTGTTQHYTLHSTRGSLWVKLSVWHLCHVTVAYNT